MRWLIVGAVASREAAHARHREEATARDEKLTRESKQGEFGSAI
jgi:hypothetical protein